MKKILMPSLVLAGLFSGQLLAGEYDKAGFVTEVEDGRLWVFKEGSESLAQFREHGEPAKQFTLIGAGPRRHDRQGRPAGDPGRVHESRLRLRPGGRLGVSVAGYC